MLLASGVVCTLLLADGKLAGWKRGRDGSLRELVLARRWELPAVRLCMARGDGGFNDSNRPVSYLGDRGDCGRIAGERGDCILGEGEREGREGEIPREGAVLVMCLAASETTMFVPDIQIRVQQSFRRERKLLCCTEAQSSRNADSAVFGRVPSFY